MTEEEKKRRLAHVRKLRKRIKPLAVTHPHLKDFSDFLPEFNKETERGAALAAAAFLDDLLQQTLAAFLIEGETTSKLLNGFNAPLSSFAARIAAAHALGLISDDERAECELIRKVRNEFAHKVKTSFEDERIRGLCAGLKYSVKPVAPETIAPRGQFSTSAVSLILTLTNRPNYVKEKKLSYRRWN
jgi:hypothetical protein